MESQCEKVLQYMRDFGSINPQQAFFDLGVMRLAARISDLKKAGHKIRKRWVCSKNRYGKDVMFAEYSLEDEQHG